MSYQDDWGLKDPKQDEFGFARDDLGADLLAQTDAAEVVRSELDPGEKLLWSGRPTGSRLWWSTIPIVVFAIPWTLFACFWIAGASGLLDGALFGGRQGPELPRGFQIGRIVFSLFGLPFVLIGLGMLSSPYWMIRHLKGTAYGITDRRVLILTPTWRGGRMVQTLLPGEVLGITRHERSDGTGDLHFDRGGRDLHFNTRARPHLHQLAFTGVPRVREVERLLKDVLMRRPQGEGGTESGS